MNKMSTPDEWMPPEWIQTIDAQCSAESDYERSGKVWSVFLLPEQIENAAGRLFENGFFLEDVTGMDSSDGQLAVYHFDHFENPGRVVLYVTVPHDKPELPSISAIFGGAQWHEREAADFFGFVFLGHPDPTPLLLPPDMDTHPLLKDDKARLPLSGLLQPGTVIEKKSDFNLLDSAAPSDPETGDH